jgi:hypothetical protein
MRHLTDSEIDAWYFTLVDTLLMAVPQLEELCISDDRKSLYRGTRVKDKNKDKVKIERMKGYDEEDRFPSKLTR